MVHLSYSNLDTGRPMKGESVKQPMYHVPTGKKCTHTTLFPRTTQLQMLATSHVSLSSRHKEP